MNTLLFLSKYFLYFIIYSFIGWLLEIIVAYRKQGRFVNRGFFIGPYCPIYGFGAIIIVVLLGSSSADPFGVFLKSIFIAGVLEYSTSYFMEKLYKFRWWDYSTKKYNINGRICLETLIPFGILAFLVFNYVHPCICKLIDLIPNKGIIIISVILFIGLLIDIIISNKMLYTISSKVSRREEDNTIEIKEQFVKWYREQSKLYQRISKAFPHFESKLESTRKKNRLFKWNNKKKS